MTSVSVVKSASGTVPTGEALLARLATGRGVFAVVVLAAGFGWLFQHWFVAQALLSLGDGNWSHSFAVPLISGYLLWRGRGGLAGAVVRPFWPGLVALLTGVTCYVFFLVGVQNHMGQGWSMVLTLMGLVLLVCGPGVMGAGFWPLAYLMFGVTVAEKIMLEVTFPLQNLASGGAYVLLTLCGLNVDLSGNIITIIDSQGEPHAMNVAQACSGMRMLIAFLALGAAVGLVGCPRWWQRVTLLATAVPVALLLNMFRVAILGVAILFNPNLAEGEAHMWIGTVLLVPGFFVYMGLMWILNHVVRDDVPGASRAAGGGA
ncbi:MAG: exosortase/archaeosortase family protein [Phycisphaerae bacterium]|nr:exosortase/archaeosortase family protein [Phycisphaerae bacterium]